MTFGPLKNIVNNGVFITLGVQRTHLGAIGEQKAVPGGPGGVQSTLRRPKSSPWEPKRGPQVSRKPSPGSPRSPKASSKGPGRVHRSPKEVPKGPKYGPYVNPTANMRLRIHSGYQTINRLRIPNNQ